MRAHHNGIKDYQYSEALKAIRRTINDSMEDYQPNAVTLAKIKQIKTICDERYRNRGYYGHADLNRKILRDANIARLIDADTIKAIMFLDIKAEREGLKNPGSDSEIAIQRNPRPDRIERISLADAIINGLADGVETLESLPSNSSSYNYASYQLQKREYRENTTAFIQAIHVIVHDLQIPNILFVAPEKQQLSLQNRLDIIVNTLKEINTPTAEEPLPLNKLLKASSGNPYYESITGLQSAWDTIKNTPPNIERFASTTLQEFAREFVNSTAALTDGDISHFLLDRVHLESGLLQPHQFTFRDGKFTIADVVKAMVIECENLPADSLAREQFQLRFNLVEKDLRERYSAIYSANKNAFVANLPQAHQVNGAPAAQAILEAKAVPAEPEANVPDAPPDPPPALPNAPQPEAAKAAGQPIINQDNAGLSVLRIQPAEAPPYVADRKNFAEIVATVDNQLNQPGAPREWTVGAIQKLPGAKQPSCEVTSITGNEKFTISPNELTTKDASEKTFIAMLKSFFILHPKREGSKFPTVTAPQAFLNTWRKVLKEVGNYTDAEITDNKLLNPSQPKPAIPLQPVEARPEAPPAQPRGPK